MESQYENSGVANPEATPEALCERAWEQFRTFLRQQGHRITEPRRIVLERALLREDHFRADDLAADLATGSSRVSRGTVYRTLSLLVEAGMLREIRDSDTHVHYEPLFGRSHHEHLICDRCKRFLEFTDPALEAQIARACERSGFTPRVHHVTIFGLCAKCAASPENIKPGEGHGLGQL